MKCLEGEECTAQVMDDRGYCSRHGGIRRHRKELKALKKRRREEARERRVAERREYQALQGLIGAKRQFEKRMRGGKVGSGLSFWSDYDRGKREAGLNQQEKDGHDEE